MAAPNSTTYEWDAANRLQSVNNGSLGSYGYDGNGQRVKKTESGVTTYYVISSVLGSVMEVTSSGVQRAYVMSGSSVVAQLNPNGSFYWLQQDHLGSGRKMTDSTGAMVYRAEFDPYGKLLYEWSSPSNLNSRKFTGYERDAATNLDYAQARMYSSDWGRFISVDKLGLTGARVTSPKSLNRYSYASGDPINRVDRNGMEDVIWFVVGDFVVNINGFLKGGPGGGGGTGSYADQIQIEDPPLDPSQSADQKTGYDYLRELAELRSAVDEVYNIMASKSECKALFGNIDSAALLKEMIKNRLIVFGESYKEISGFGPGAGTKTTPFRDTTVAVASVVPGFMPFEILQILGGGNSASIPFSSSLRNKREITINLNSAFFGRQNWEFAADSNGNQIYAYMYSQVSNQAATLIHELLHVAQKIRDDGLGSPVDQSLQNSWIVYSACIGP